jgi:ssDNA-binding Zn-finger/Zn-ribbon topoisomerase 1
MLKNKFKLIKSQDMDDFDKKQNPVEYQCPKCINGKLIFKVGTFMGDFWHCSNMPPCRYTAFNFEGKPLEINIKPFSIN